MYGIILISFCLFCFAVEAFTEDGAIHVLRDARGLTKSKKKKIRADEFKKWIRQENYDIMKEGAIIYRVTYAHLILWFETFQLGELISRLPIDGGHRLTTIRQL